jgi:4-hydroxybenzoate polyprenyltransferase
MSVPFLVLAIVSAFWGIVSAVVIATSLSKRGVKINYIFLRILMLKYIHQYRKITIQENGRPGPWFYSFVVSMNLALIFGIAGIVLLRF